MLSKLTRFRWLKKPDSARDCHPGGCRGVAKSRVGSLQSLACGITAGVRRAYQGNSSLVKAASPLSIFITSCATAAQCGPTKLSSETFVERLSSIVRLLRRGRATGRHRSDHNNDTGLRCVINGEETRWETNTVSRRRENWRRR
jgi:hypothetical protein